MLFKNTLSNIRRNLRGIKSEMEDVRDFLKENENVLYEKIVNRSIKKIDKLITKYAEYTEDDIDEYTADEVADKVVTILAKFYSEVEIGLRRKYNTTTTNLSMKVFELFDENLDIEREEVSVETMNLTAEPCEGCEEKHGTIFNIEMFSRIIRYINEYGEEEKYMIRGKAYVYSKNFKYE